jgi:hypothetical protein
MLNNLLKRLSPLGGGSKSWDSYWTPQSLVAIVISNTAINLTWEGGKLAKVERSTDGVSFSEIGTGTDAYSDTGLTAGTLYCYRIKGTYYSNSLYVETWQTNASALILRQIAAADEPNAARKVLLNNTLKLANTKSFYAKLDAVYLFASHGSASSLLNILSANFNASIPQGSTFTADKGHLGNGNSQYIETGYNPSSGTKLYVRNSASAGFYSETDKQEDSCDVSGAISGVSNLFVETAWTDGKTYADINDITGISGNNTTSLGLFIITRTNATACPLYKNKSVLINGSQASTNIFNANINFGCFFRLTRSQYSTRRLSLGLIGGALTAQDVIDIYDIFVRYYLGTVGAFTNITREGQTVTSVDAGTADIETLTIANPVKYNYKNNNITCVNTEGHIIMGGTESTASTDNNIDQAVYSGNRIIWNGIDMTKITHGIFCGFMKDVDIKYNYLEKVPYPIVRKGNGMTDTMNAVKYNIINKGKNGVLCKGAAGVKIYNNTFYSDRSVADAYPTVDVFSNGGVLNSPNCKVFNNIFYTVNQLTNIRLIEAADAVGFESDYNVFYCEAGTPMFDYLGTPKTFVQWQALGFDAHSVVIDPNFIDFTNFVPTARLNYGKNLGIDYITGLATNAVWGTTDPATTDQTGVWQVGARVYSS